MNTTAASVIQMAATSVTNKGGTFAADGTQPTEGYAVTVAVVDKVDAMTITAIEGFVPFIPEGGYLGTWWDHENKVWEISETAVFSDRDDALRLAALLNERYVYDLSEGAEIAVPESVTA